MMERLNFAYSTKIIPIPTEKNHKLQVIEKTAIYKKKLVESYRLRYET